MSKDSSNFALLELKKQWQIEKLLQMHVPHKRIRLGKSTKSIIEEYTPTFNLFFYFLLFDDSKPRYKLFFQGVRKLLAKIVETPLAGPQTPLDGWRMHRQMEFLPILQDFVPYQGRCPATL